MTTKDEALKLALEELLCYQEKVEGEWGICRSNEKLEADGETNPVITLIKEALAQPEQEIDYWIRQYTEARQAEWATSRELEYLRAQPEQEPKREWVENTLLSHEVIERAGREWWAQTKHTNGPRILAQYANQQLMDEIHNDAKIIITAAINAAQHTKEKNT